MIPRVGRSVRTGIALNTAAELTGRGLSMVAGVILAKVFAPDTLGRFFGDQAMILMGGGLYNLGVGQAFRLLSSRDPDSRGEVLAAALGFRFVMMLLYGAVVVGVLAQKPVGAATAIVAWSTLLMSVVELVQIDWVGRRQYLVAGLVGLSKGLVLLVPASIVMATDGSYDRFVFAYGVVVVTTVVGGLWSVAPGLKAPSAQTLRSVIVTAVPFILAIGAFGFTNSFGLYWIGEHGGSRFAGEYGVAWKIYQVGLVLGMAASTVSLPIFHQLAAGKKWSELARQRERVVSASVWVVGMLGVVLVHASEHVIRLVATSEYDGARVLMLPLTLALLLRTASIPFENELEAGGRQRLRVTILIAGAAISTVGVVQLGPRLGILGVALTACLVDAVLFLAMYASPWRSALGEGARRSRILLHLAVFGGLVWLGRSTGLGVGLAMIGHLFAWVAYGWWAMGMRLEVRSLLRPSSR